VKERKLRPNWNEIFMNVAYEVARMSTCRKIHVGAAIVKDKRIISIGYNGVPSGWRHCDEVFTGNEEDFLKKHHEWSNYHEIHAEMNAIAFAAKNGISTQGAELYCTHSPCVNCSKIIVQSGIERVYYAELYDGHAIDFLREAGVEVIHFNPKDF